MAREHAQLYEVFACGQRYVGTINVVYLTLNGEDIWHVHLTNADDGRIALIARADEVQSVTPLED